MYCSTMWYVELSRNSTRNQVLAYRGERSKSSDFFLENVMLESLLDDFTRQAPALVTLKVDNGQTGKSHVLFMLCN